MRGFVLWQWCASAPVMICPNCSRQVDLSEDSFKPAPQAGYSIPFVRRSVHNVPGGPPGAGPRQVALSMLAPKYEQCGIPDWV